MAGLLVTFHFTDEALAANDMSREDVMEEFGPENENMKYFLDNGVDVKILEVREGSNAVVVML